MVMGSGDYPHMLGSIDARILHRETRHPAPRKKETESFKAGGRSPLSTTL